MHMVRQLKLNLAQAVRVSRRARGVSQEKLATAAGIHRTYMSAIERGKVNVSLDVADRLAGAMGIRLSDLVRLAEEVQGKGR
jgi:transcriptional regulator with XRE-family HTH domain